MPGVGSILRRGRECSECGQQRARVHVSDRIVSEEEKSVDRPEDNDVSLQEALDETRHKDAARNTTEV